MEQLVTKEMTMGEIIEKYPYAAQIMEQFGLHCTGCHVNLFESLESGIRGHGLPEQQIAALVNALNEAVQKNGSMPVIQEHDNKPPLALTSASINKLKSVLEQQNKKNYGIRVQVIPGGCSGYMYSMDLEEKPANDDTIQDFDGVRIFVDKNSEKLLRGVQVDYVETLQGGGFKFDNPNAHGSCGCGKSFH